MRAAVVRAPGRAPEPAEHPDPVTAPGRCLVRVTAAPVTPLDLLCASGTSYFGTPATPYVPGVQGVGTVVESGALPTGTRVWFATTAGTAPGDGSLAEQASAPDDDTVALTGLDAVPDAQVAALGLSAVAAWRCLADRARLRPGERVLVLGAGGVVGQVALQAARLLGAGRVVGACRPGAAVRRARAAGADDVVLLDAGAEELARRYAQALDGAADVVIDPLCGLPASAAVEVLAPRGRLVNLGGSAGPTASFSSATLRSRSASILGYTNADLTPAQRRRALLEVLRHAAAGRLAVPHEAVPLAEVTAAWQRQRDGAARGRIVVRP